MKTLQITNKEKIAILVMFLITLSSNILAKTLGVGEISTELSFVTLRNTTTWMVYLIEILFLIVVWLVRRMIRFDKVSRVGFVLILGGTLGIVVWRILFGSMIWWINIGYISTFNLSELMILLGGLFVFLGIIWHGIE
jgi:lipoprotein signal peptidase